MEQDILIFDVVPDPQLKTIYSQREIPVHKKLIELGFATYVKTVGDYLFPDFISGKRLDKKGADKWRDKMSKELSKFLRFHNLKRKELRFNSLRHNFVDACRNAPGMPYDVSMWLQGRVEEGSVKGYGVGPDLAVKKASIGNLYKSPVSRFI